MIEQIADFYKTYSYKPFVNDKSLTDAINKHIEYGTLTVLKDRIGIAALLRFDVIGECVHVLDLIVREDVELMDVLKQIVMESWKKFPYTKYFRFERKSKYPTRSPRAYQISKLIKEK